MKKFVIIFCILITKQVLAQQNYLNVRANYANSDIGHSVLPYDSGYVILNSYLTTNLQVGFEIIKTDWNLYILSARNYIDSSQQGDIYVGLNGSFENDNDSVLFFSGSRKYADNQLALFTFNFNGDTIWTKEFGDTSYQAGWQCKKTRDKGYASVLKSESYNGTTGASLIKMDSLGNLLWSKNYPHIRYEAAISMDTAFDGGYILAGGSLNYGVPINSECMNLHCIKVDSVGNIQWRKTFGGPYYDAAWRVIQSKDSSYILAGLYTDFDPSPATSCADGNGIGRPYLIKLNQNGDTIWTKKYGPSGHFTGVKVLRELENGDLIAAGQTYVDSLNTSLGLIMKINSNGDSLWYRTFWNILSENATNTIFDIRQTPDMGFIASGYIVPGSLPSDTGHQDTWILKIDSNGCEVANCVVNTTIEEESASTLTIYPNPSSGRFTILSNGSIIRELTVYDRLGKQIIAQKGNIKEIDLENFANGIYFYRVECASKVLTGRLVKQ
jgi:hypothetical protein